MCLVEVKDILFSKLVLIVMMCLKDGLLINVVFFFNFL